MDFGHSGTGGVAATIGSIELEKKVEAAANVANTPISRESGA